MHQWQCMVCGCAYGSNTFKFFLIEGEQTKLRNSWANCFIIINLILFHNAMREHLDNLQNKYHRQPSEGIDYVCVLAQHTFVRSFGAVVYTSVDHK